MRLHAPIAALVLAACLAPGAHAQLYATGSAVGGQNRYYSIDVATGVATQLSGAPALATTTTGLAFTPSGVAYGVTNAGQLCLPDFSSNTFTNVGPFGFNPPGIPINSGNLDILADGRAFIYQTNEYSPLFQVNLATGAVTPIGGEMTLTTALQLAGGAVGGFDQPIIIGMGSIGGTLYAVEGRTNSLVAIDPTTGDVTVPTGLAGQLAGGTLLNGNDRSRYVAFNGSSSIAGVSGYDSDADGQYDKLFGIVNTFDGNRLGALIEINVANGTWELVGTGNAPVNFFALGAPIAPPPCVADFDDGSGTGTPDGGVDISDLLYFLFLFDAGHLDADIDDGSGTGTPDAGVDISDLLYFLVRFDAGC